MKIIDPKARSAFSGPGRCELCGLWTQSRDAHHTFVKKGMGGGSQIDVPENLAALHRVPCHNFAENSKLGNREVQLRVARRCGLDPADILDAIRAIRNLPKGSDAEAEAILEDLRGRRDADHQAGQPRHRVPAGEAGPAPDGGLGGLEAGQAGEWIAF